MSRYYSKCPKCGNTDLYSECQWDTVTAQGCEECGWHKEIGYVGGFAGEHYLVPYDDYYDCEDYEDDYDNGLDPEDELVQLDQIDPNSEDWDELELLDDDDPLPF